MTEIMALAKGLEDRGISYTSHFLHGGTQIKCDTWDAVCHSFSYGGNQGLLETMGLNINNCCEYDDDGVMGFLTAQDILDYLDTLANNFNVSPPN